jgi:hypothetical protein
MAGAMKMKAADIVFEGVVIPKGTRSAKLAARGIINTDELGNFLTAIFSDTLNGKITLPTPSSSTRVPSKLLSGLGEKLRQGLPIKIAATKSTPKTKSQIQRNKQTKEQVKEKSMSILESR